MNARRTAEAEALTALGQLSTLLELSAEPVVLLDASARVSGWNRAAQDLLGWSSVELLGQPLVPTVLTDDDARFGRAWSELGATEGARTLITTARTRDGSDLAVTLRLAGVAHVVQVAGAVLMVHPAARILRPGGNVPTVLLDHDDLVRRLTTPVPAGSARAVALVDIDHLALVNQAHGRDVGAQVVRLLGDRLAQAAAGVSFGSWEDDAFVAVVDDPDARGIMSVLAERLHEAVRHPLLVAEQQIELSVSAGLSTGEAAEARGLLVAAADALAMAKVTGRDRTVWFEPSMQPADAPDARRAAELRRGIASGELRLHLQPVIELAGGTLRGVEALVRWERPGIGLVQPGEFIELAERTGAIVPLGAWVTQQACQVAAQLSAPDRLPVRVSINLSARQLADPMLLDMLADAIVDAGCAPGVIEIEVTETALMHDLALAKETLVAMKALGVGLALDDFGTGYSSLVYLKNFPVDRIKIDRSFVTGLGEDPDDTAIVASTISLAHSMGMRCVAEGVETPEQLRLLRRMQCDYAQGYVISRPLDLPALRAWQPPALPDSDEVPRPPRIATRLPHATRIMQMHAAGASLTTIAAALNADNLRTERGVRWSASSVARVIAATHYPGVPLA